MQSIHSSNAISLVAISPTHRGISCALFGSLAKKEDRTGHGLDLLILDEPTESLGTEDGSIGRLADAISHLRSVEQIIAVTHSEDFANRSEHLIRVRKEAGKSVVALER